MNYEWLALIVILGLVAGFSVTKRWVRWPFRLRTLIWCGGFSYLLLLILPRIYIWPAAQTLAKLGFAVLLMIIFAWIMAYHHHDDQG
jgi:hypothetical protein